MAAPDGVICREVTEKIVDLFLDPALDHVAGAAEGFVVDTGFAEPESLDNHNFVAAAGLDHSDIEPAADCTSLIHQQGVHTAVAGFGEGGTAGQDLDFDSAG